MIEWFYSQTQPALAQLIFAHGAGAGSDSEFMQHMARLMSEQGIHVGLFDFEYMQVAKRTHKRRPPERAPKLLGYYESVLTHTSFNLPLFIGGKSMGGRIASMLACTTEQPVLGSENKHGKSSVIGDSLAYSFSSPSSSSVDLLRRL